ncbi:TetR/AcrR family transcriptional regulator [Bradyrhizobium sp. CB1650]|uniref:TetR/AcrR family transcriptional regulator n=1 Tax=Bradyrhizobium sp. CB1650 TaxID=3039153 RepID=UPI002434D8F0|nr:TetR/AcrR family transcriptional regulator [Bradyrhizobium sp. CB1650]WGD53138.1 TetR/AcrR family transcriptional regulator [Bradyrhizobium sp. CB1650]
MRYVKGHKLQTRSRILEEASYGLRQAGADGISVSDLMKRAGLTHGGFYAYFESREALMIEAFATAMDRTISQWRNHMDGLPAEKRFDAFVETYLRSSHRDDRARGCVLPALGTDIARSSYKARRAFARKLDEMIDVIATLLPEQQPKQARQIATATLAAMMGTIALSRAVGGNKLSDEILSAGRRALNGQSAKRKTAVACRAGPSK